MKKETGTPGFTIRSATEDDISVIFSFIRELAEYEKLSHEVAATEEALRRTLFGPRSFAEVVIGEYHDEAAGFALFFHNY
ncbi:MAG: GNAT family N-acetyltransferase, partial [Planctomycetota bacterium]